MEENSFLQRTKHPDRNKTMFDRVFWSFVKTEKELLSDNKLLGFYKHTKLKCVTICRHISTETHSHIYIHKHYTYIYTFVYI